MRKIDNITPFSFFGISLIIFSWLAVLLAILGLFKSWLIIVAACLLVLVFSYSIFIFQKKSRFSWDFSLVIISALVAVLLFSYFTVPTIFSGRDQGALSSAAISLVQNHTLESSFPAEFEFFKIYGPGAALNFPGFYYTTQGALVSQFPLGYTSYLAAFYALFGLGGLIVANACAFFIFLISFYTVARNYLETNSSLVAFFLVVTSFVFSWFFKFTLSENLALALIWFGLAEFLLFWKTERQLNFLAFLLSFGLLLFVRIESIAFLAVAGVILYLKYKKQKTDSKKTFLNWKTYTTVVFILFVLFLSLRVSYPFYTSLAKGFLNSFNFYAGDGAGGGNPLNGTFYILRVFSAYALLTYLALALIALFYFLKKKSFEKLLPYFILLPAFVYLINPSISLDHPWMLRRYIFAVIPISILYSIIFLKDFLRANKFFYLFVFFLFLTNALIFSPLLGVRENPTLLSQIETLSQNFQNNDLILVDRNATGNPWAMMSGPLNLIFKKQAVYFFNPDDLEKIDLTKFGKVYLIAPDNNLDLYRKNGFLDKFITLRSYSLNNFTLSQTNQSKREFYQNPVVLPPYLENYTYGNIYILRQN